MPASDITITEANVKLSTGNVGQSLKGIAGATIAKAAVLYKDSSDSNKLKLADCSAAGTSDVVGLAFSSGAADDAIEYKATGDIVVGSVLTAFATYVLSSTAGLIMLASDLTSGDTFVVIGHAISTTTLRLTINNTGIQKA